MLDTIKVLNCRFEKLAEMKNDLGLQKLDSHMGSYQRGPRGPASTSVLDQHVIGRDDDKKRIVKWLTQNEAKHSSNKLPFLPIVGMGGVGKTTLAQLVFHDDDVEKHFDLRIWVWISQNFDPFSILRRIISDIEGQACTLESLQDLHKKVQKVIVYKKFLLMLDDVWNEDKQLWDRVLMPLRSGNKGSSVIITTRSHHVAKSIHGHMDTIVLKGLNDVCIQNVMEYCAFGGPADPSKHLYLIEIGKEILKKLKGSPLAAKVIGHLLSTDLRIEHWKRILSSEIWEVDGQSEHGILPSLMLSYQNLSPDLRQCFRLCSLFPKGYKFDVKGGNRVNIHEETKAYYIWMAHGIFQDKIDMSPEDCARDAIRDLLSMSLLQEDEYGSLTMHDLIHDVSEHVAQDDHLRITDGIYPKKYPSKVRHLSLSYSNTDQPLDARLLDVPCKYEKLRTLLTMGIRNKYDDFVKKMLEKSTCLRVLDLSHSRIDELLASICNQKHLRYLDLSYTNIRKFHLLLKLYNLEALFLNHCKYLSEVPDAIGQLIHLRYLGLSKTSVSKLPESLSSLINLQVLEVYSEKLSNLPDETTKLVNLRILKAEPDTIGKLKGIGRMTSLRELKKFQVKKTNDWGIEQLENLDMLDGILEITCLENVADEDMARKANLQRKVNLERLTLEWTWKNEVDPQLAGGVLEALQPSGCNLTCLVIKGYKGRVFPSWLTDGSHYPNLKDIELLNWGACVDAKIKCPLSLSKLFISGFRSCSNLVLQCIPTSLKILNINEAGITEESLKTSLSSMTSLEELTLMNCPNLSEPFQKKVVIDSMKESLKKLQIGGGNWGFYFTLEERHSSTWRMEITHLKYSSQDATSAQQWAWGLLLGITSRARELKITECNIKSLDSFGELFLKMTTLSELSIMKCSQLLSLPRCPNIEWLEESALPSSSYAFDRNEVANLHREPSYKQDLPSVSRSRCYSSAKMQSIPNISLPASLKRLHIQICESLALLPSDMRGLTSLEKLLIQFCPSMKSMSDVCLPSSLKELSIEDCVSLTLLPSDMRGVISLKRLRLQNCPLMREIRLPASTESLSIDGCQRLTSLPPDMSGLTSLRELQLKKCPRILPISNDCLLPSLELLSIDYCESSTSSPSDMRRLTSLKNLMLLSCREMSKCCLPASLESLSIENCNSLTSIPFDTRGLSSLKKLKLNNCRKMHSMSDVLLPASIESLRITYCQKLESLPSEMKGLVSLREFYLHDCPEIISIPGPPASLRVLEILHCSKLKKKYCRENGGQDWRHLSGVPDIRWEAMESIANKITETNGVSQ